MKRPITTPVNAEGGFLNHEGHEGGTKVTKKMKKTAWSSEPLVCLGVLRALVVEYFWLRHEQTAGVSQFDRRML